MGYLVGRAGCLDYGAELQRRGLVAVRKDRHLSLAEARNLVITALRQLVTIHANNPTVPILPVDTDYRAILGSAPEGCSRLAPKFDWSDPKEIEMDSVWNVEGPNRFLVKGDKVGRNQPCPCDSGKKFKKCCGV